MISALRSANAYPNIIKANLDLLYRMRVGRERGSLVAEARLGGELPVGD
jgi:hypothetical protein